MKKFEIEVSKVVQGDFVAETEDEAVDMAQKEFDKKLVEVFVMGVTDLGEDEPCQPIVNEINEDSLNKLTDKELDNLKSTIDMIKLARAKQARKEAIQTFNEAVKRICDLNLTITAFSDDGDSIDIYDAQSLEVIL